MIGSQIGHQTLTILGSAVSLMLPTDKRPQHMRASVEIGAVRWMAGPGLTPTPSDGQLEPVGSVIAPDLFLNPGIPASNLIANFKVVSVAGTATVQVEYFD